MKNIVSLLIIVFFSISTFAQTNMYVRQTDGTLISFSISDIDSIFYINTFADPVDDYDGNTYQAVQIGNQIWMKENLKTTHYSDGTAIPFISDNTEWANLADDDISDAYCYYNNNTSGESATYGALYTWAAAMNKTSSSSTNPSEVQGACPTGWHIPSNLEWDELVAFLGSDVAGNKMKTTGTNLWSSTTEDVTNESGFSAIPSGYRNNSTGVFTNLESATYFWSTTDDNTNIVIQNLNAASPSILSFSIAKSIGFSVRCVKD